MRKFKHKITGYIATETNSEKNYKVSEPKNFTIPKWIVENSNDWEEIKEEFPKIISFRRTDASKYVINLTGRDNYNGWSLNGMLHAGECVDSGDFEIYQVAISETETFTLGDRVTYNYKANYAPWIIDNFFIRTDGKILARSKSNSICEIVSEIEKAPEPLFITEDGAEIYEGDEYWCIYYNTIPRGLWKIKKEKCSKFPFSVLSHTIATFKSEELAKKYFDENKSIYSKKQVREAIESSFVRETYILDTPYCQIDRFKEDIFKQKLGL